MSFAITLPPHAAFIIAAYVTTVVVIIGLIAWVRQDYRAQRRRLMELESGGTLRRSRRAADGQPGVAREKA